MADLWIGNVAEDASDDEISQFLRGYGFPAFDTIQRVTGTGTRPAVVLGFKDVSSYALRTLQPRVHNIFWKNRTLMVQVMPERDET